MKVTILGVDDWAWLFVDNKLHYQGHNIDAHHILEALDINYEYKYFEDEDYAVDLCHDSKLKLSDVDISKLED